MNVPIDTFKQVFIDWVDSLQLTTLVTALQFYQHVNISVGIFWTSIRTVSLIETVNEACTLP